MIINISRNLSFYAQVSAFLLQKDNAKAGTLPQQSII